MGPHFAIFWVMLAAGLPRSADVSWSAGVPLWKSLSPAGQVIDAGHFGDWGSPPPAARLGTRPLQAPADELPPPRELPDAVGEAAGPLLPPGVPLPQLLISPPTNTPLPPRPEINVPPVAAQATDPRRIRTAGEGYTPGKSFVPRGSRPDEPAARLVPPLR